MNKIKFIHFSDIHVGLQTHGKINPATGKNTRLEDILSSLDFVVDYAAHRQVDLIVIAGDVFHRENPHPTEEIEFAKRIERITRESEAKVVMVLGNHDYPTASGRASAVEIFPALNIPGVTILTKPLVLSVDTKNGTVQIASLPWATRAMLLTKDEYKSMNPEELNLEIEKRIIGIIREQKKALDRTLPSIFLAHLSVRDAKLSGTERDTLTTSDPTIPTSELASSAFNYVALGHIHKFQDLNKGSEPPVVYSGSLERIDFSEEKEKKGFVYGELERDREGWKCSYEFVESPARKFLTINIKSDDLSHNEAPLLSKLNDTEDPVNSDATGHMSSEGHEENPIDHEKLFINGPSDEDVRDAVVRVRYTVSDPGEIIDEKSIKSGLENAHSIKIEKIFEKPKKVIRQTGLTRTMSVMEALDLYLRSKPELKNMTSGMKEAARKLIDES